jgi:1-acyl-sn-glycerol-3-phosphate acyltransferase
MVSLSALRTGLRGVALTAPFVACLFLADVVLSLLLPVKVLAPKFVYDASSSIATPIWHWIQVIFVHFNGARITISGDPLAKGASAIVVANHVAWSDFYMIQCLALQAGMLGRCRYFAKKQLRMVPFLGWGLWAMGMPMVSRNWLKDKSELDRVFNPIVQGAYPTCKISCLTWEWTAFRCQSHATLYAMLTGDIGLVSFSESTRFTSKKYEESKQWCKETNRRQPQHLLYPRTKGFITTVQQLRKAPHVRWVYDLTIAYQHKDRFQRSPTMWDTLSVPRLTDELGFKFHVHVRRFPICELPDKDEDLAGWLEQLWIEKGIWLESQRQAWAFQEPA